MHRQQVTMQRRLQRRHCCQQPAGRQRRDDERKGPATACEDSRRRHEASSSRRTEPIAASSSRCSCAGLVKRASELARWRWWLPIASDGQSCGGGGVVASSLLCRNYSLENNAGRRQCTSSSLEGNRLGNLMDCKFPSTPARWRDETWRRRA
jgi:hypothetical protein